MSKQTDSFYNKFSFFYPLVDVFLKSQKKVLFAHINSLPDGHLLEIGVGNGSHFGLYKKHRVIGIDTSAAMLNAARKHCNERIQLLEMNGESLLFEDEKFDYVVLSHVIAVVDHPEQLLNQVWRVLKPHGQLFILNHFTPPNWLGYIDGAFQQVSKMLHFRSVFHIHQIAAIKNFTLLKHLNFGAASYFKLLIYQKR
ncbi:class I SAM-dependent methyltransferase [Mucilaginibacter calamicampi]|uniref:Class I SAM-dependent methyltransferase n=1 Tax=Mucilaginibacter calamicampi TaxID=1302352 RepID=A0ABW2YSW5_9SPHI